MKFLPAFTLLALCLAGLGCGQPTTPAAPAPQRFEVRGILRAINFAEQEVTVAHEEIPGFMPAMTMPLAVREMREVEALRAGDAIGFQLIVTDTDSWITEVRKIDAREVRLPMAEAARPEKKLRRLKEGDQMPDFALTDHQGRPISRETFGGKPLVLTFIFTRCPLPNYCPLMSNHLGAIRAAVADEPKLEGDLQLLSISFDPEFDTPEKLAAYAARYTSEHERWRFATGALEQIEKLTAAFAVQVQQEGGTINHGLATALVGRDGIIRKIWRGNGWQPAEVVEELRQL